jgi:D,D-heptose 1,7-bisphosphate phosphatase
MQLENKEFQNSIMIPKNRAIFLDRDGVLNKDRNDYVKNIDELEIFPFIGKCIRQINEQGFLVIVITNQSAIGRKLITHNDVENIHKFIQKFLKKHDAKIDAFYYCPHHPIANCDCRKPKPGLLIKASYDFSIDLKNSWMIGDNDRDVESGLSAGCKSIKVTSENTLEDIINNILKS